MNTIRNCILLITAVFLLSRCQEDLDVDYTGKSENRLVVDGMITTDTMRHTVKLSRTLDYSSDEEIRVSDAVMTISDGESIFPLTENSPGIYQTDSTVYGEIGKTYTLNIVLDNGETYEAVSELTSVAKTDSIICKKEYFNLTDENFYKIYFYGQEPQELGQYYLWNVYLNDSLYNDTINESAFESDEWVNGSYMTDFDVYWIEEDVITSDTTTILLEMVSLTEDYYLFLVDVMLETTWRGGPFDSAPANIRTNVNNGALGYFSAHAIDRKKTVYIKSREETN